MIAALLDGQIPGVSLIEGPGKMAVVRIRTPVAEADLFVHGAQLTHWKPAGHAPVIFLSAESAFTLGKALRGGVPVCFPWFGPREGSPAHGFVRNREWTVESVTGQSDGAVEVTFATQSDAQTQELWPHDYLVRLTYTIGATLNMALEVTNTSASAFTFSEALHTYLAVGDAREAEVQGLESDWYRDFPDRSVLLQQTGPIRFTAETDRVYVNTDAACTLEDPVGRRRIIVKKVGSLSTTVWNPWISKAAALADFGDDEWPQMVCIETVNAAENSVTLGAGLRHVMTAHLSVEKY